MNDQTIGYDISLAQIVDRLPASEFMRMINDVFIRGLAEAWGCRGYCDHMMLNNSIRIEIHCRGLLIPGIERMMQEILRDPADASKYIVADTRQDTPAVVFNTPMLLTSDVHRVNVDHYATATPAKVKNQRRIISIDIK